MASRMPVANSRAYTFRQPRMIRMPLPAWRAITTFCVERAPASRQSRYAFPCPTGSPRQHRMCAGCSSVRRHLRVSAGRRPSAAAMSATDANRRAGSTSIALSIVPATWLGTCGARSRGRSGTCVAAIAILAATSAAPEKSCSCSPVSNQYAVAPRAKTSLWTLCSGSGCSKACRYLGCGCFWGGTVRRSGCSPGRHE